MSIHEEFSTLDGFSIPTKIFAGREKLGVIQELLQNFKAKNVLLVYDKGIAKVGIAEKVKAFIDPEKYTIFEYSGVLPDPPFQTVKEAVNQLKDAQIDTCIAIGGGSSIDTAKAITAVFTHPERPLDDLLDGSLYMERKGISFIAIPTTSGTGSEVTVGTVITDDHGFKKALMVPPPDAAILDPSLTVGLPISVTIFTAMDALTHCIGGYTSVKSTPLSDAFAEKGIRLVLNNLSILKENSENLEAREEMAYAATLGGLTINGAMAHIDHSFAHVIGGKYHIPHGAACAMPLPFVVDFISDAQPDKVKSLCDIFGIDTKDMLVKEVGTTAKNFLLSLNEQFGIPKLSSYENVSINDIDELAKDTSEEMFVSFCPKKFELNDAKAIYQKIFAL